MEGMMHNSVIEQHRGILKKVEVFEVPDFVLISNDQNLKL